MVNFPPYSETLVFFVKGAAAAAAAGVVLMLMMIKTAMERHSTISKCLLSLSSGFVTSDGRVDTTSVTCEGYFGTISWCSDRAPGYSTHEHDDNDSDGGVRHESRSLAWTWRERIGNCCTLSVSPLDSREDAL